MWLIFLLLEAGLCLLNESAINSQRTLSKQVFCTYFTREGYYSSYYSSVPPSDYTVSLNVDISSLNSNLYYYLLDKAIQTSAQLDSSFTFLTPFVILTCVAILLVVLTSAILLGCWFCYDRCPPRSCVKPKFGLSKCQLYWPVMVSLLFGLVVLTGLMLSFMFGSGVQFHLESGRCLYAITLDDLINGNIDPSISDEHNNPLFWSGFSLLADEVSIFNDSLNETYSLISEMQTLYEDTLVFEQNAEEKISLLPSGSYSDRTPFGYQSPFNLDTTSTSTINSTLNQYLGNYYGDGQTKRVMDEMYPYYQIIERLKSLSDSMLQQMQGDLSTQINRLIRNLNDMKATTEVMEEQFYMTMIQFTPLFNLGFLFLKLIIACALSLIVFLLATMLCYSINQKYSLKTFMNCLCATFIVLLVILGFIGILLSLLQPIVSAHCQYQQTSDYYMAYPAGLPKYMDESIFNAFISEDVHQYYDSQSMLAIFTNSDYLYSKMRDYKDFLIDCYQVDELKNQFPEWEELHGKIYDYYYGVELDFDSQTDEDILRELSDPSEYTECTDSSFQADSWVPSIQATSRFPCYSSPLVNGTQCSTQSLIKDPDSACAGCIDTYQVLKTISSSISSDLSERYDNTSTGCLAWVEQMENVWQNYYAIKETVFDTENLLGRTDDTEVQMGIFKLAVQDMRVNTARLLGELEETTSSNLVDPYKGVINGWSYNIITSDIQYMTSVCSQLSFALNATIVSIFCTLYSMVILLIFLTLAVFRHNSFSQRGQRYSIPMRQKRKYIDIRLF